MSGCCTILRNPPTDAPAGHAARPRLLTRSPAYRADYRDPFAPSPLLFTTTPPNEGPENTTDAPGPTPPPLRLLGVVGPTAIVRDSHAVVHLVARGDTLHGIRILRVRPDTVEVEHDGLVFSIGL